MRLVTGFFAAAVVYCTSALAINVGDTAPTFSITTYGDAPFDLAQQKGKVTVLLFCCFRCPWAWTIGPMVEDSIAKKFSGSQVSVLGLDMYSAADLDIRRLIDSVDITFPIAQKGESIGNIYKADYYSIFVIDSAGFVRFAHEFPLFVSGDKKTVSDAAATVRSLIATGIVSSKASIVFAGRNSVHELRYYMLSGQSLAQSKPSMRTGIVLRRCDGRAKGVVQFGKPNP